MCQVKAAAEGCMEELRQLRRAIHRHPETGRNEFKTSALIREKLLEYGVDCVMSPVPTAVVALIRGKKGPGKCIALRADIDALPIQESTGLPYESQVPGVMHACGHDMHTAMLLGAAKLLCAMREEFSGAVKLIFQHSEDTLPGGALELIEKGVLEDPHVDALYALHVMPDAEKVGKVGIRPGPMTTSVDLYDVTVTGSGGHGSAPHTTQDPILCACQMIVNLQQVISRRVDPMESAVLSVGVIHGGEAVNIIPKEVKFNCVARVFSEEVREVIRTQVHDIARGMEAISGCSVGIYHYYGYPAAYNDPTLIAAAREALTAELGEENVVELERPAPFSEDFAYYRKETGTPSAYLLLYAGHEGEEVFPLHSARCAMREEAMPSGVRALVSIALGQLKA